MIIAIDFDGTCVTHNYPRIGQNIGAIPVLNELITNGHKIILWTMRSGNELQDAVKWFQENNIPLFGINSNPQQGSWTTSPKAYAHLYIDDAALGIPLIQSEFSSDRPYVDWIEIRKLLINSGVIKN